jgi:hypothetical protein
VAVLRRLVRDRYGVRPLTRAEIAAWQVGIAAAMDKHRPVVRQVWRPMAYAEYQRAKGQRL